MEKAGALGVCAGMGKQMVTQSGTRIPALDINTCHLLRAYMLGTELKSSHTLPHSIL